MIRPKTKILLTGLLLGALAALCFFYFYPSAKPSLTIIFVDRNQDPLSDRLHQRAIEDLISKYNRTRSGDLALRLEIHDADTATKSPRLKTIYADLSARNDVLAVIDNCWGSEIESAKAEMQKLSAPIIYINGDRNGNDFGMAKGARLFLGDGEVVKDQMGPLLELLLHLSDSASASQPAAHPATFPSSRQYAYVGEKNYRLNIPFLAALKEKNLSPAWTLELLGDPSKDPAPDELARIESELLKCFPAPKSHAQKLIVLNCHTKWGQALLPWIDETFETATVVGYQSIDSRSAHPFQNPNNQLLILGQSPTSVSDELVTEYREQRKEHPDLYGKNDDLLYVRRCFAAMDLITRALDQSAGELPRTAHSPAALREITNRRMQSYHGKPVKTALGVLHFNLDGAETGSNHILLSRNGVTFSYPRQLNSNNQPVPNIQFGFQDVKITDVSVSSQTFRGDFYFWVRFDENAIQPLLPDDKTDLAASLFKLLDFSNHTTESYQVAVISTQKFRSIKQILFHVSGTFSGTLGGRMYPFDQQRISIELRVLLDDDQLRISPDQYAVTTNSADEARIEGWQILSSRLTVNNRITNDLLIPREDLSDFREQQYSHAMLSFDVRRGFWSPVLLVFCPLALMVLASLAVLFLKPTPAEAAHAFPSLERQSELTLVCMLTVITYLVSYASLAPRLAQPTLADALVGFTLFIAVANFVLCVAISQRNLPSIFGLITLHRYRTVAAILCILVFGCWFIAALTL